MVLQNPPQKGFISCNDLQWFRHLGGRRRGDLRSGALRTPQNAYVLLWFQRGTAYPSLLQEPMFSYRNIDTFEGPGQRVFSGIHLEHHFKALFVTFWEGPRAHAESRPRNS